MACSISAQYGGYDYTFCDPLPDECPCPVCTLVQKDPYQLTCCGKMFCKSCLYLLIEQNTSCPNCRGNFIKGNKYFPDVNTERKIKHLRIRCENEKQGCTWSGYLKDMKKSHIPKCPYDLVQCTCQKFPEKMWPQPQTLVCCETRVQRRNLQKHMIAECEWRLVACVYCELEGTFYFMTNKHTAETCNIVCTNDGCQEKVNRNQLKTHQESCPHKIVACRYSSVGCVRKIKKRDIESHNKECMEEHLESAVQVVNDIRIRLNGIYDYIEEAEEIRTEQIQDCNNIRVRLNRVFERTELLEEKGYQDKNTAHSPLQYYQ